MKQLSLSDLIIPNSPQEDVLHEGKLDERIATVCPTSISSDSRTVTPGGVFVAIAGEHSDGHAFIPKVIESGVTAIVYERDLSPMETALLAGRGIVAVRVQHSRRALSRMAARFHGNPSRKLCLIGVTGTDGKSSSVYFLYQLLKLSGIACGFVSTVAMDTGEGYEENSLRQSTPEPLELHALLAKMVANGLTHAVIEATSHGLSERTARLADVDFQGAIFTNLTHEHLEFHGSFEQYRKDKSRLFGKLSSKDGVGFEPFGVVNFGDPSADAFVRAAAGAVTGYARVGGETESVPKIDSAVAEFSASPSRIDMSGVEFVLKKSSGQSTLVRAPLPGVFNIDNVTACLIAAGRVLSRDPFDLVPYAARLKGVKGRMIPVVEGQDFSVVVDYAHSPGSYETVFPAFRSLSPNRLIAVFGSAGERDHEKRPMQGAIAARFADVLVLTNEDPRLEDPKAIIDAIATGALRENPSLPIYKIEDRAEAIRFALSLAKRGDSVVLLGKGHEQSIIYADGKHPWDEETEARKALRELPAVDRKHSR